MDFLDHAGGNGRGGPPGDVFRFQELDTDDEFALHGVPVEHMAQKRGNNFVNDASYYLDSGFGGDDVFGVGEDYGPTGYDAQGGYVLDRRESDEMIAQRALERIRRARMYGQENVTLSHSELDALEYGRLRQQEESPSRSSAKPKSSSKQSSSKSSSKSKKGPASRSSFFATSSSTRPTSSSGGRKRSSTVSTQDEHYAQVPPGFILPGPNGAQVYAPIAYDGNGLGRVRSSSISRPGSRSASNDRGTPPRAVLDQLPGAFPAYSSPLRPTSSSNRRPSDEELWLHRARSRSSSSSYTNGHPFPQQQAPYPTAPNDLYYYQQPNGTHQAQGGVALQPQHQPYQQHSQQGRRIVSSPADVPPTYAQVPRRVPVGANARVPTAVAANSDPNLNSVHANTAGGRHNSLPGGWPVSSVSENTNGTTTYRYSSLGQEQHYGTTNEDAGEGEDEEGEGDMIDVVPEGASSRVRVAGGTNANSGSDSNGNTSGERKGRSDGEKGHSRHKSSSGKTKHRKGSRR
jgi:hypothetical protein